MDSANPHAYAYAYHNKTICLIEEPLFTVDNQETMKLLMGGETMLLNPKNMPPFISKNEAVVIITANSVPWINYPPKPFENRCYAFNMINECKLDFKLDRDIFWTLINLLYF